MADVTEIYPSDRGALAAMERLLRAEGIRCDRNLDYRCGIYDDDFRLIATGSCFANTLRCFAVDAGHQGEGLLNTIVTHLLEVQHARGNRNVFLYTKETAAKFFRDLGFYEVARVPGELVFMESQKDGFASALRRFRQEAALPAAAPPAAARAAAIVLNANPFTLGHQYLIEAAARENERLHLFLVSEDASLVPFAVRKRLVQAGIAHLSGTVLHDSGPYIISNATFPSYFQKDDAAASRSHARLDAAIFARIAAALGIARRYVGEEPFSEVTGIYNQALLETLPRAGIECCILPRRESGGRPISASEVRLLLQKGDFAALRALVPPTTLQYFQSEEGASVIAAIQDAEQVVHH